MKKWPNNYYLVNHKYKIIYCAIPKNASGFLRRWFLILSGHNTDDLPSKNIGKLLSPYILKNKKLINKYNKFSFVRNPYSRLVSAFINKFSIHNKQVHKITHPVISYIQKNIDNNVNEYNITFKHFAEYLYQKNNLKNEDDHWKPQWMFLNNIDFNFIGKIETFNENFKKLHDLFSLPYIKKMPDITNKHNYENNTTYNASNINISKLSEMKILPYYKCFFDKDIEIKMSDIYSRDLIKFQYKL